MTVDVGSIQDWLISIAALGVAVFGVHCGVWAWQTYQGMLSEREIDH